MRDVRRGRDANPRAAGQLRELADQLGVTLGATGTHPWSPWQEQRIIDTPHYRLRDELLRYVVWRNNSFGLHVHVAIQEPTARSRFRRAAHLPAGAAGLVGELPVRREREHRAPLRAHADLHALLPALRRARRLWGLEHVRRTTSDALRDRVDLRIRRRCGGASGHLGFPTVEIRISDAQPLQEEAIALAALSYSLAARIARAVDEGEPLLLPTNREIEENFWRAIRWGLSGELIDLRTRGAAGASCDRGADRVGAAGRRRARNGGVPDRAGGERGERQIARLEEGASLEEIYAEQIRHSMEPVSG